jgi:TadE-like protein.
MQPPNRRISRTRGQAIVEFALAATLIFFLLAAVVDLGLIFFTLQAMRAAAQEGAAFGSYPVRVVNPDGSTNRVDLDYNKIVQRVRLANGTAGGGFANLLDLDNNGVDDSAQGGTILNPRNNASYIFVELMGGSVNPSGELILTSNACPTSTPGQGMQRGGRYPGGSCWVRVTVRYNYKFLFPLAPAFGETVQLQVVQVMPVRSSFYTTP